MNGAGRYSGGSFAGRSGYSGNNFSRGSFASRGTLAGGGGKGVVVTASFPELPTEAAFLEVVSRVEEDMVVGGIKRRISTWEQEPTVLRMDDKIGGVEAKLAGG